MHNDEYHEYTDETFDKRSLLTLQKLELITKDRDEHQIFGERFDEENPK